MLSASVYMERHSSSVQSKGQDDLLFNPLETSDHFGTELNFKYIYIFFIKSYRSYKTLNEPGWWGEVSAWKVSADEFSRESQAKRPEQKTAGDII